jgi:hypothetical protein
MLIPLAILLQKEATVLKKQSRRSGSAGLAAGWMILQIRLQEHGEDASDAMMTKALTMLCVVSGSHGRRKTCGLII